MNQEKQKFYHELWKVALPITIQSLFQSSLGVIDQMMVGRLGSICIAGTGLGGKFASIFSVTVSALCTAAGILIAQFYGKKDYEGISKSFKVNLFFAVMLGSIFTLVSLAFSTKILSFYALEHAIIDSGAQYLRVVAIGFLPMTVTLMISTLLRSMGFASFPMYASVASVLINTVLNYVLIFGKLGCPALGVVGAALATTLSRVVEMAIIIGYLVKLIRAKKIQLLGRLKIEQNFLMKTWKIAYPILACEFLWTLGENIYATIYGRMGTLSCAAMALTNPIQGLAIGALTGISAATGIMVGNELGAGHEEGAYEKAKTFIKIGLGGTLILSIVVAILTPFYVRLFNVEQEVRQIAISILWVYAFIVPVKVLNMIAEGGILRSGGKTHYTLILDTIGTWGIGIPLGLLGAYILKWPIYFVYLLLSLEEVFRLIATLVLFKQRKWMKNIT
ncbi:MAG: MATE family efflux transporter [Cellulosilyticum sp.]|nr:MATE family efflux transporter [Cellulosilyticum sp.]